MIVEVKAGVRTSNKNPRAIVLDKMIKVSSTSSTNENEQPESNRGKDLGVDDRTDFNHPLIVHSRTSIVHSRFILHSQNLYRTRI